METAVVELGNGDAAVYYQGTVAGEYQLAVRLAGSEVLIGGSAIAVRVEAGVVAPASCQVRRSSELAWGPK